jgi:hypothetical protein
MGNRMAGSDNGNFDQDRVFRDIKSLSIPRRTGTMGDRITADYLANAFGEIDVSLASEKFCFSAFPNEVGSRLLPLVVWMVVLTAMKLHHSNPVVSALLFGGLLLASIPGTRWSKFVEIFYDLRLLKRKSTNLVAVLKPKEVKGRLVLLAHRDSKSQTLPLYLRLSIYMMFFFSVAGVALLYLGFMIAGVTDLIIYLWFPSLLLAIPLFLMIFNVSGNDSPGGIDNATGLSILLELARGIKEKEMMGIEVVFLLTGAEEEGLPGAIRFVQKKTADYNPHNTYFLNLDGVGATGGLVLSSRHSFPAVRTGGRLETILTKLAKDEGIALRKVYFPTSPGLEHAPIAHKGYRAITLTSSDFSRATLSIHTGWDVAENVDPDIVKDCYTLIFKLLQVLEEGVSSG